MPSTDATTRAYLAWEWMPVRVGLEPVQGETLVIRALTQGRTVALTRDDTNRDAADAGGKWWRDGMLRLFDRGLVTPYTVHPDRAEWGWVDDAAELAARRLVRDDENMHWTWMAPDDHEAAEPSLAELVEMLAWDMRFQGTGVMDLDGTDPTQVVIHEERLYGVTKDWETRVLTASGRTFDWEALDGFARSSTPKDAKWFGPARLSDRLRLNVFEALLKRAGDLFSEPRLRVNLSTWTVTAHGQHPARWEDLLPANTKNALAYLEAPPFDTHTQFVDWVAHGGLYLSVPCQPSVTAGTETTLRIDPASGQVTTVAIRDATAAVVVETEHVLLALAGGECACTQGRIILESSLQDSTWVDATSAGPKPSEPEWMTRARAITFVVRGYRHQQHTVRPTVA